MLGFGDPIGAKRDLVEGLPARGRQRGFGDVGATRNRDGAGRPDKPERIPNRARRHESRGNPRDGQALRYNAQEGYLNPDFLVYGDPECFRRWPPKG
jgi:hypothetical protein